jgi:hypothetical protein
MIRGVDYITIEVFGINQSFMATIEECQELVDENDMFKDFKAEVLNHRKGTGYIDLALYPKDGDIRAFIAEVKKRGLYEYA